MDDAFIALAEGAADMGSIAEHHPAQESEQ
jgi:hypothetical protein